MTHPTRSLAHSGTQSLATARTLIGKPSASTTGRLGDELDEVLSRRTARLAPTATRVALIANRPSELDDQINGLRQIESGIDAMTPALRANRSGEGSPLTPRGGDG